MVSMTKVRFSKEVIARTSQPLSTLAGCAEGKDLTDQTCYDKCKEGYIAAKESCTCPAVTGTSEPEVTVTVAPETPVYETSLATSAEPSVTVTYSASAYEVPYYSVHAYEVPAYSVPSYEVPSITAYSVPSESPWYEVPSSYPAPQYPVYSVPSATTECAPKSTGYDVPIYSGAESTSVFVAVALAVVAVL
jgi:hypothetical protein